VNIEIDFFTLWRWMLALVVMIYSGIVLWQTAAGYWVWLSSGDRYTGILRRYLMVHSLRVRARAFGADIAVCLLLCVTLGLLGWLHWLGVGGQL